MIVNMSEKDKTRRWFLRGSAVAGTIALAGCVGSDDDDDPNGDDNGDDDANGDDNGDDNGVANGDDDPNGDDDANGDDDLEPSTYEIWAADQGTDSIYIYEGVEGSDEFTPLDEIDTTAETDGFVPHMVHFTSDYEYAAVACTAGARVLVYRTDDRELVGDIETGPGSHFAGFTPDDDGIVVDVIGESEIAYVSADLDTETFEIESVIEINESVEGLTEQEGAPICHSYTHDGRSVHTLGPSYNNAGLVIVDHDDFSVDAAFSGAEIPTNCGTMPHPTEEKFYLTAGLPTPTDDDGEPLPDEEGVGDYYVLDTSDGGAEIIQEDDTGGVDAHGFWFTNDGEELWVLNRETNDGVVIDPETDAVVEEIPAYGPSQPDDPENTADRDAPDILWASPDGEWMFVTLRGPEPVSGDPHAATGVTPGFGVLNTDTKQIETVVEPDPIEEYSDEEIADDETPTPDFHGIGVRPVGEFDGQVGSPPY